MNRYQFHNLSTLARLNQGGKGREFFANVTMRDGLIQGVK